MKRRERRPRWGWLYAIFGLMVALFYFETRLALTDGQRVFVQIGILGLVYFLADVWVASNMPFDHWS